VSIEGVSKIDIKIYDVMVTASGSLEIKIDTTLQWFQPQLLESKGIGRANTVSRAITSISTVMITGDGSRWSKR